MPADSKQPGRADSNQLSTAVKDAPRRSPMLTSLSRYLPHAAASLAEMEALRRRAWRQDGVLTLRDGDDRLSWPERELVRQLGDRLYGARRAARGAMALAPPTEIDEGDRSMSDASIKFWTLAEIEARLEEAAKTLVALKLTIRDIPSRHMVRWPDVVRGSLDAFGFTPQRPRVAAPTPAAIDRADETVAWLLWMGARLQDRLAQIGRPRRPQPHDAAQSARGRAWCYSRAAQCAADKR